VELLALLVPPLLIAFALVMEAVENRLLRHEQSHGQKGRQAGAAGDRPADPPGARTAPPTPGPAPRPDENADRPRPHVTPADLHRHRYRPVRNLRSEAEFDESLRRANLRPSRFPKLPRRWGDTG
jgi:hypothetical protein